MRDLGLWYVKFGVGSPRKEVCEMILQTFCESMSRNRKKTRKLRLKNRKNFTLFFLNSRLRKNHSQTEQLKRVIAITRDIRSERNLKATIEKKNWCNFHPASPRKCSDTRWEEPPYSNIVRMLEITEYKVIAELRMNLIDRRPLRGGNLLWASSIQ